MSEVQEKVIPTAFIERRSHSIAGLWLVLFLIMHLLTNSQAALFIGDDGSGFIHAVNSIHSFPYLPVIEIVLLGIPIAVHLIWGIKYLFTAKYNSHSTDGSKPDLKQYSRNHAYTWQRITAWLLVVGIIAHVIHMRFIEEPILTKSGGVHHYIVRLNDDPGLYTLSERLNFKIYNAESIKTINDEPLQKTLQTSLKPGQVLGVANDFGTAELLVVRDTFKMPIMLVLYTLLVLSACFHAFNGLWTFMISWGVTLSAYSQRIMRHVATALMVLVAFLGLAAIWGTYWLNLRS